MKIITNLFQSSLGKKYIMAVTGLILFLFVLGHMIGNLQVFLGREAINRYAYFLQSNVELLWPVRLIMLSVVGLHIWSAIRLSIENKAARPIGYGQYNPVGSSYASRTMLMSGLILFCFIVFHLLHYTVQVSAVNLTHQNFASFAEALPGQVPAERHDVFKMLVVGFNNPLVSGFYILGMLFLCLHLSHGISSLFQSLGLQNPTYRVILENAARLISIVIFLGYTSIPVAILCGYGKEALK